ncbi:alkaline phosphatase family protein [Gordonia neofelifaecis]|uniref:Type I phosphodiesterase/nucleotide pyrophosphatase n=1 Tax=Gordonia neofelifaecis NRRL B-59395 TaxID=644548 RepID=F1YNJ6_9ACTN|nr:nucleotide pyrophosphatase/phosphodiesterase family protein [Gordonia neofelifaecis]EGD53733.1 type I phosphodiesterase/nucleotide pyrophosphatase [Gordonia neofelifaecis NRRL B-59395]
MRRTLADVLPAVTEALAGRGDNALDLAPARDVVVLLIDGLGARLIARHSEIAPTLAAHVRATLRAGFPATTATSISSLAVGAPCATHGIIGYSFGLPSADGPENFNALRWRTGGAAGTDARETHAPEWLQPTPSVVQELAERGVEIHYVVPAYQVESGLTRAAFRTPGLLHPAESLAAVRDGILEVARHPDAGRRFAYAYHPDLDMHGHISGPESAEWLAELGAIDAMVADLLSDLPSSCTLLITGDHGMICAGDVIDLEADPDLSRDVELISGEARVRHVYARSPGSAAVVQDRWTAVLGDHALVVSREQALDEHWFGATPPTETIAARIGDVVAVARGTAVLTCPTAEPLESTMVGHHGALTDDEQLVPLIVSGGAAG